MGLSGERPDDLASMDGESAVPPGEGRSQSSAPEVAGAAAVEDAGSLAAPSAAAPPAAASPAEADSTGIAEPSPGSGDEPPRPTVAGSALRAATGADDAGAADAGVRSEALDEGAAVATDPGVGDAAADPGDEAVGATPNVTETADTVATLDPTTTAAPPPGAGESEPSDPGPEGETGEPDENLMAWRAVPLTVRIEALLFAATSPLPLRKLQSLAGDVDAGDVNAGIDSLQAHYEASGRAFTIHEIGGGYQLRTRTELSGLLSQLGRKTAQEKLSPAAIETLAIVAYRQPVLRVDVEKIRGVASGEVLRTLVEKGLVRVAGRADLPGSPLLYGTTAEFLEIFGLRDLRDLPSDRELLRRPV